MGKDSIRYGLTRNGPEVDAQRRREQAVNDAADRLIREREAEARAEAAEKRRK